MSQIFQSIGGALSGALSKLGGIGGGAANGGSNLGSGIERAAGIGLGVPSLISQWQYANAQKQQINNLLQLQQKYANLTPGQVSSDVSSLTKPLDNSLVQGVGNQVQAALAERGLSQAPGIYASSLGQGLAPYLQQNQQTAAQLWSNMKQLPFYVPQPQFPQQPGFQGILSMIAGNKQPSLQQLLTMMQPKQSAAPAPVFNNPTDTGNVGDTGLASIPWLPQGATA